MTPAAKKNTRGKKASSASKKTPAAVPEGGEKESADRKPAAKKGSAKKAAQAASDAGADKPAKKRSAKKAGASDAGGDKSAKKTTRGRKKKEAEVAEEVIDDIETGDDEDFEPTGEDLKDPDLETDADDEDEAE